MQGWLYGKGVIYLMANISAHKICLPQGQSYTVSFLYSPEKFLLFEQGPVISLEFGVGVLRPAHAGRSTERFFAWKFFFFPFLFVFFTPLQPFTSLLVIHFLR